MQNTAFTVWQNISGTGMLTALYVFAVVFLFFQEKETYKRIVFVYLPAFWIMLLMLPVTYKIVAEVIDEELYYRFFWLLPMTLTIAYALVQAYHLYKGAHRKLAAVSIILLILVSGDFVYNNWRYEKAENIYHVPQSVVELCDLMHAEGREVMALFPTDLMQYVRQYDSTICLPYGRDVLVEDWSIDHPLYNMMEGEELDADELGQTASAFNCAYIILQEEKEMTGDLTKYGYSLKDTCQGYRLFYNDDIFMSIYE